MVSDPVMHERLDPRCRLVSATGKTGEPGSGYELTVRAGGTVLRWTVTLPGGGLTGRLAGASAKKQLRTWLAAVEREAKSSNR